MALPRANWKGHLTLGELNCAVALFSGASTTDRIAFHILNRKTGNRVRREFIDPATGKAVDRDDQVKGYEVSAGSYVVLEPEEIARVMPESDKTLAIESFIPCDQIDTVYFDKPYYLAPADGLSQDTFVVLREGMASGKVAALARAILFRRVRALLISPDGPGLIAHTLKFDYEIRPAAEAFDEIPALKIKGEMLDLAKHIIKTKQGRFDPAGFDDRYEAAVAELVKAKMEGRPVKRRPAPAATKVVDLMDALRASAAGASRGGRKAPRAKAKAEATAPRRKVRKAG